MTEQTTPAAAAPEKVSVGLPSGLDPEKVRARKSALIAAGTEPLLAEKLASVAEEQQLRRDAENKKAEAKAADAKKPATKPAGEEGTK